MKSVKFSILFSFAICLLAAVSVFSQTDTFKDATVEYTFDLPETGWKQIVSPSKISPNVEFVYGDRSGGHLEVRKLAVKDRDTLSDAISAEEQKLQFLPGYVAGKEENFKGSLAGRVFNYEFVRSARNMSGRFYFLRAADGATVYVLRFTGMRDKLRSIRNQTDSIARTFVLVKK